MSLARALTTIGKRKKSDDGAIMSSFVGRAASQRAGRPIARTDISSPMALVSTSNMQVHNAKHIAGTAAIEICHVESTTSSNASVSGDESDNGTMLYGSEAHTDASSVDESPIRTEPEPNHLSCYFKPSVDTTTSTSTSTSPISSPSLSSCGDPFDTTPRLPQRVPSHSKKAHERLHRTRSLQRIMSSSPRRGIARSSTDSHTASKESSFVEAPGRDSPFGPELAQLDEVAEEFGQVVQKAEADADAEYMSANGLARFAAEDYLSEIHALIVETFGTTSSEPGRTDWF